MEITYPFARVFTDNTNKLNCFFDESPEYNTFKQLEAIGKNIVEFCELDFSEVFSEIKKLDTKTASSDNFEVLKKQLWKIVDLLKDKHDYAHFFLNSQMLLTYYNEDMPKAEQIDFVIYLFEYYAGLQNTYKAALEICLSKDVLTEYTLPERFVIFGNNYPTYNRYMLRTRYGIAPMSYGEFDPKRRVKCSDLDTIDTRKVLADIHRDSQTPVNLTSYFAIQTLDEMLYLEFMEMIKRGIGIKRCSLCDKYFVLADKRKRDYCDRIFGDTNRTCKQVGAKLKFNKSVEEDIYLQEFQRIYNRMYSRFYREDAPDSIRHTNKLSEDEFKEWVTRASIARQDYRLGTIGGDDMIKIISN